MAVAFLALVALPLLAFLALVVCHLILVVRLIRLRGQLRTHLVENEPTWGQPGSPTKLRHWAVLPPDSFSSPLTEGLAKRYRVVFWYVMGMALLEVLICFCAFVLLVVFFGPRVVQLS